MLPNPNGSIHADALRNVPQELNIEESRYFYTIANYLSDLSSLMLP